MVAKDARRISNLRIELDGLPPAVVRLVEYTLWALSTGLPCAKISAYVPRIMSYRQEEHCQKLIEALSE